MATNPFDQFDDESEVVPQGGGGAYGGGGIGTGKPLRVEVRGDAPPEANPFDRFDQDKGYDEPVGHVGVPPSQSIGRQLADSTVNTVAGLGQGYASLVDIPTNALGAVMGEFGNAVGHVSGYLADQFGMDGDRIRAAGEDYRRNSYKPITIGGIIENAAPTPDDMTGKGVRFVSQLAGGAKALPGGGELARTFGAGAVPGAKLARGLTEGQEVYQAADRLGMADKLLPADVGGPIVRRITAGKVQTPFGATPIIEQAKLGVEAAKGARGRIAAMAGTPADEEAAGNILRNAFERAAAQPGRRISGTRDLTVDRIGEAADSTSAGQMIQRGANRFIADTAKRGGELFEKIPIPPSKAATLSNTKGALESMTAGMESNPELGNMFRSARLEGYLEALTGKKINVETGLLDAAGKPMTRETTQGGALSWGDLKEFRTRVGDMMSEPRLSEKIAPRQLKTLYAALSKDMEATAKADGPAAYRLWKRANDYWDGRSKRIEDTLSAVLGQRKDMTPNETFSQLERWMKPGSNEAPAIGRLLRSLPKEDVSQIRATIASRFGLGKDGEFTPKIFAEQWSKIPERERAAMFPNQDVRAAFDDMAGKFVSSRDAADFGDLAGSGGTQAFNALNRMAGPNGDPARLQRLFTALSPDEAATVRATWINRAGQARAGAQDATGEVFSPATFVTQWNTLSPRAKTIMFGDAGDLRGALDDLATVMGGIKGAAKYANTSNTAGANSVNATSGGLFGAGVAAISGHPIVAALLAAPAAEQAITGRLMASPAFVRHLVKIAKTAPSAGSGVLRQRIAGLSAVAAREPALAADVANVQQLMLRGLNDNVSIARAAAEEQDSEENQ